MVEHQGSGRQNRSSAMCVNLPGGDGYRIREMSQNISLSGEAARARNFDLGDAASRMRTHSIVKSAMKVGEVIMAYFPHFMLNYRMVLFFRCSAACSAGRNGVITSADVA